MIRKVKLVELLAKHMEDQLTEAEQLELEKYLDQMDSIDSEALWTKTQRLIKKDRPVRRWLAVHHAAAVLLILFAYYSLSHFHKKRIPPSVISPIAIAGPILTLSDGKCIRLDSMPIGAGILCNGWWMERTGTRQVAYLSFTDLRRQAGGLHKVSNMLSLPSGTSWVLGLPDGSKVQLNARSSLTYDLVPPGRQAHGTKLSLEGEAFFDMKHSPHIPYTVSTDKGKIMVLGTRFNVRDYQADSIMLITLFTGSVMVSSHLKKVTLKPGQQASISRQSDGIHVSSNTDTAQTISWTFPYFDFTDKNIAQVMRQLERWYGLETTVFRGNVDTLTPGLLGGGHVSRNLSLPELMGTLQQDDLLFAVKGNKCFVSRSAIPSLFKQ